MSFSSLFHAARLSIHVPPPSVGPAPEEPTAESAQRWVHDLLANSSRRQAFYDEDLRAYLSVKLPAPPPAAPREGSSSAASLPQPTPELLAFLRHLQVTVDSSYVSPVSGEGSPAATSTSAFRQDGGHYPFPATPTGVPSTPPASRRASGALSTLPPHLARRVSGGPPLPVGAAMPSTPLPTPSVGSSEERRYIRSEGVSVFSAIWAPSDTIGVHLGWSADEGLWVAVWGLDVPVAFVRTKITEPLLCLTASITLRDKALVPSVRGYETFVSSIPSSSEASPTLRGFDEDIVNPSATADEDLLRGLSKAAFPAARFRGPQPSISSHPTLSLSQSQGPRVVPPTTLLSLPTLRKSFRTVLELASGLSLRMRTVYLPHLVPDGAAADGGSVDGGEDEEEERKVVVSVEVESAGGAGLGFEIDRINFKVGGAGGSTARVELLGGERQTFPLELADGDQFSLLYVVSFAPSATPEPYAAAQAPLPSASLSAFQPRAQKQPAQASSAPAAPALPESHRPVSISVRGRPFVVAEHGAAEKDHPTAGFVSKWNCTLDLSHLAEASEEKLNLPAMAGVPSAIGSTPAGRAAPARPPSLVAGNKRFSVANVSSFAHPSAPPSRPGGPNGGGPVTAAQRERESFATPLPTPAFPPQGAAPILPPSQQPFTGSAQHQSLPVSTPNRLTHARAPSTLPAQHPQQFSHDAPYYQHEEDGILVSINVLRLAASGAYVPLRRKDAVRPFEPFVLEVFVFNGTPTARRFVLGIPEKRRRRFPLEPSSGGTTDGEGWAGVCGLGSTALCARLAEYTASATPLIPLENAIRVGPLSPRTSQSVRMRFLPLSEGVHQVDTLGLVGVGDGFAVNLKSVCNVIVKA